MTLKQASGLRAAALVLSIALSPAALAGLGGSADSVATDSAALRGQLVSTPYVQYDVQQITVGALTVNEYVTRSGQVFAVTWHGPVRPNLQQLLGSYYGRFQSAAVTAHQNMSGIRRQLMVAQPDVVIEAIGRLRSFHGIAYLPSLVPDGVSISELQ